MAFEDRMLCGIEFLRKLGCASVPHSTRTLLDHLIGTHDLLRSWGAPEAVCLAGLFHSVYGTDSFRARLEQEPSRGTIAGLIGADAESLAWQFGTMTKESFWEQVGLLARSSEDANAFVLQNRTTKSNIPCSREQLLNIVDLVLANEIDQGQHMRDHYTPAKCSVLGSLLPYAALKATAAFTKTFDVKLPQIERSEAPDRLGGTRNPARGAKV
jgi:hypothetical protein